MIKILHLLLAYDVLHLLKYREVLLLKSQLVLAQLTLLFNQALVLSLDLVHQIVDKTA